MILNKEGTPNKVKEVFMKAGKIWGKTELIEANGSCEFHRIDFVKGGVCSKHKHEYKWNGFFVESGKIHSSIVLGRYFSTQRNSFMI